MKTEQEKLNRKNHVRHPRVPAQRNTQKFSHAVDNDDVRKKSHG